jgi:phage shock protein C
LYQHEEEKMADTKRCPYCAEEIRVEATRCRFCRSRLTSFDEARWHRSHREARLAGVCAAIANAFAFPVSAVRLLFVVLTIVPGHIGPLLYFGLWLIVPARPGAESQLERLLRWGLDQASRFSGRQGPPSDARHLSES